MVKKAESLTGQWWVSLIFGLALLAAAYGFGSWALNTANMWAYLLTIVSLVGGVHRLVKGVRYAFGR